MKIQNRTALELENICPGKTLTCVHLHRGQDQLVVNAQSL